MSDHLNGLVSTEWLANNLDAADLVILDASRHLPAANRDPRADFEAAHIPGARFLDLATLTDTSSDVPQALPSPAQLAERLASLGVQSGHKIVLYDDSAVRTSARAWFTLIAHGIDDVAILDGGFAKWRSEGRKTEAGEATYETCETATLPAANGVRFKADMLANVQNGDEQVLDARGADRVFGDGPDPVHGGENGRIPGSCNLPFNQVFAEDGTYKSPGALKTAFEQSGIDLSRPLVTSCGSGVTASILLFALHLIGKYDIALYDGSWAEWSADPDTPKQQGPQ
ncbi:sulfurtransferase [Erythrobacter crassostreae]|uniref:Sulfurtransferase n=1 Tax=Erythrobacter crassostreae TaxID=2828328 RepID=A0A9X1JKV2_9SPHN|nr:sulfurtransferase [Erythrobacter crassostrea]MBV7259346.1 sulfurtransferase [Erythrobacter crassostrea]